MAMVGWEFKVQYQLYLFFKTHGKWTEIPYVQIFFQLRDMKKLYLKYGIVVHPKSEILGKWC